MAHYLKKLEEWKAAGLVENEAYDRILTYEKTGKRTSWMIYALSAFGVVILALGLIAVIAANWEKTPAMIKLICNFVCLLGIGGAVFWSKEKEKRVFFEGSLLLFFFWCLSSIGLIAQIYHLSGPLYNTLFLWTGITFGLAFFARSMVMPFFWVGGLTIGFSSLLLDAFGHLLSHVSLMVGLVIVMVGIGCSLQWYVRSLPWFAERLGVNVSHWPQNIPLSKAFLLWALMMGGMGQFFPFGSFNYLTKDHQFSPLLYLLLLGVSLGVLTNSFLKKSQKAAITIGLLLFVFSCHVEVIQHSDFLLSFIGTVAGSGSFVSVAFYFASLEKRASFNTMIFFAALNLFVQYLIYTSDMGILGMNLIVTGALVLGLIFVWQKNEKRLFEKSKEMTS